MRPANGPSILYYSRRNLWWGYGLSACLATGGYLLLANPQPELNHPLWGGALLAVALTVALLLARRFHRRPVAVIASRQGLWLAPYKALGVIPWSEILDLRAAPDEVELFEGRPQPSNNLLVELARPSFWIAQMPNSLVQAMMRLNQTHYRAAIMFNCWELERGLREADQVVALLHYYKSQLYLDDDAALWPSPAGYGGAPKLA